MNYGKSGLEMHPYATDSNERKFIIFYIAALSIFIAWIFYKVFEVSQIPIPWWINIPSALGIYSLIYLLFKKYAWKLRLFRAIGMITIPDLNGIWKGKITSSYDNNKKHYNAVIKIFQNWTELLIILETKTSKSNSLVAGIVTEGSNESILSYDFLNEPNADAKDTMQIHRGTVRLTLSPEGDRLNGQYYSGRGRKNIGTMDFYRE